MGEERVWLRTFAGSAGHLTARWQRLMEPARGDPLGAGRQALQTGLRTRLERFEQRSLKKRRGSHGILGASRCAWQIVLAEASLMNAFTKTLQTLHFVQSQRAVEKIAAVEAVTPPSNRNDAGGVS